MRGREEALASRGREDGTGREAVMIERWEGPRETQEALQRPLARLAVVGRTGRSQSSEGCGLGGWEVTGRLSTTGQTGGAAGLGESTMALALGAEFRGHGPFVPGFSPLWLPGTEAGEEATLWKALLPGIPSLSLGL